MAEEVDNNDGTGNQDDDAIYEATISCLNLLNSLTKQADSSATLSPGNASERSVQDAAFLEDMARSFNIWINYTGALADLSRCLDFRLKGYDDIRDMVLELLQMLERNLEYVETRDSDHELEEEATESIRQAVDELHFMASAIRRSSVRSQNFMLSSAFEKSDDPFFENSAFLIVKNTFPHARRSLCKQIGASLALRRKRLLRQMQHEQKLGTRRQPTKETVIKVEAPRDPVVPLQPFPPQPENLPIRLQTSQAKARDIRTKSVDTGSHLDAGMARHYIAKGPTLSTISTGSSVRLSSREYPPKPDFPEGAVDCQCPYCARRLPTARLKNHSTFWDDHLDEDVQPYVCLSEECTAPLLFFVGMKQWVDHMNSVHSKQWNRKIHMSTWYCDIGHEETHQFDDLESFIAHMKAPESHPDRQPPSDLQIDTLSRTKQRILIREDEYSCFLCNCIPDKLKPVIPTSDPETILYELHKHIASHIKDLAPLSVPRIDATEERGKEVSEADDQERGRWLKDGEKASHPSGFDEWVQAISFSFSSGSSAHILLPEDSLDEIEDDSAQDEYEEGKTPITPAPAIGEWDFVFEPPRGHPKDFPSLEDDETIGKFRKARNATRTKRQSLTKEPPDTLTSVSNLGSVLESQGKYEEAEAMHRRALEGKEKVLGPEHPHTLTSVSYLGLVLESQGKYEEAEAMHRRDLEGSEKVLGPEHLDTLASVSNLGSVLESQGKYEEAEAMHQRALEGKDKVLGPEHPHTLTSVSNLGSVLSRQGKYEEAEAMHWRALQGSEKVLRVEHPDTLTSVSNLASVLQYQGKYEAAEEMNRRALEGREKALGNNHPDTLTSVYCLAFLFHQRHWYEAASALYERACSGYQRVLGPEHPTTPACSQHYSSLMQEM